MIDEVQSRIHVREQGQQACLAGRPDNACPYAEGTSAFHEWMRGYKDELYRVPKSFPAKAA